MNSLSGQLCKKVDLDTEIYQYIVSDFLKEQLLTHRKQWEYVYIFRMLELSKKLGSDNRGLGFGCGYERLIPALALTGTNLVVTDLENGWFKGDTEGWNAYIPSVINHEELYARIITKDVDMNWIPEDLKQQQFDFVWSCSSMDHLGGIHFGLNFVIQSMECLKPGGISVHTTELNLRGLFESAAMGFKEDNTTINSPEVCFFRQMDFHWLQKHIESMEHKIYPINYDYGSEPEDRQIDVPPYNNEVHLKLQSFGFDCTSIGFVIEKHS